MDQQPPKLPIRLVRTIINPFQRFFQLEASSGILLIICTIGALAWANSPWAESYHHLWETEVTFAFGDFELSKHLIHWINDGLMAIFFFVVGLEIKRELLTGELASPQKAALPIMAAIGGIVVPAGIYIAFNFNGPYVNGWGVPIATDIAFALGVLVLLGKRVPLALKVFLTALAIVDDLGAVLVVAIFYTDQIYWESVGIAAGILAFLTVLNLTGVRYVPLYGIIGIILWVVVLKSGIHATIAGVLLALTIPARTKDPVTGFAQDHKSLMGELKQVHTQTDTEWLDHTGQTILQSMYANAGKMISPLYRLEHGLHSWVGYLVMPIFALANAGVQVSGESMQHFGDPVLLGILLGLVIGKPVGILLASLLAIRLGWAALPRGLTRMHLLGAACLGGIGFTMSIFIANLAFAGPDVLQLAKLGILAGSIIAGVAGWFILSRGKPVIEE